MHEKGDQITYVCTKSSSQLTYYLGLTQIEKRGRATSCLISSHCLEFVQKCYIFEISSGSLHCHPTRVFFMEVVEPHPPPLSQAVHRRYMPLPPPLSYLMDHPSILIDLIKLTFLTWDRSMEKKIRP